MVTRLIHLEGTPNFRDIGGYTTSSGKAIKTQMIYRSGHLAKLTGSDLKLIEKLDLKLILDLRNPQEIEQSPNRLPVKNTPPVLYLDFKEPGMDYKALYKKVLRGKLGDFDFREFLLDEYRRYITQCSNEIKRFFQILLNPEHYPLLIHCNGGKDRTGLLVALVHFALGVSNDAVFQDYMLSQQSMQRYVRNMMLKIKLLSLFRANLKQLKPALETHSEYLREALTTIEQQHGSIDNYLDNLGMNNEARIRLCDILCTN